jgi:uncharacterized coiled-coil protein SlyX
LLEKEDEMKELQQKNTLNTDAITTLSDQLSEVRQEIEILKKQKRH